MTSTSVHFLSLSVSVFLLTCLPPVRAEAQQGELTQEVRRAVVDSLARNLRQFYVSADTGALIASVLERNRPRYYAIPDPAHLADALTFDMQSVNGDKHLSVSYSAPSAPDAVPRGHEAPTAPGGAGVNEAGRRDHWGIPRTEVLAGNVGYMKVTLFEGSPQAIEATSAALAFLQGTDAIIFDFRGMGGGSGEQSNFLLSHFLSADPVPSLRITSRLEGTSVRSTMATVPGIRRPDTPLWILTDRGTASAGEDFAFVLHQLRRARVVGDRTAGAGHNNIMTPLGHGFTASISVTRVADAHTGEEWEGVGVAPDVMVAPRDALPIAHLAALDLLIGSEHDEAYRSGLTAARAAVAAGLARVTVAPERLAAYVGTYEGGRVIAVEQDGLTFRRFATRPPRALIALDDSTFVLGGNRRLSFARRDGTAMMTQEMPDGSHVTFKRLGEAPADRAP